MDNDSANPDGIGGMSHTMRRIAKQRAPQPTSLVTEIHGQPGQDGDGDRIRHVTPELAGDAR